MTATPILGLRTVVYRVPDLDRAKAWYSSVLGIAPYFDEPFYVGFNVGGYELGLDPSRRAEAGYLKGLVTQALFSSLMGSFTMEAPGREAIRERVASIESDTTIAATRRGELAAFYRNLDKMLGSLDRVQSAVPDSAARRNAGPRIRTRDMTAEAAEPRSAFEVTFPSAVMWALIGVCMSFAISIVHDRGEPLAPLFFLSTSARTFCQPIRCSRARFLLLTRAGARSVRSVRVDVHRRTQECA